MDSQVRGIGTLSSMALKRLQKELQDFKARPPTGCGEILHVDNLQHWYVSLKVLGDSIFASEEFLVSLTFTSEYPMDSPITTFVVGRVPFSERDWKAPETSHIYSNGHICLSILGKEWSPVITSRSILISLQSMLASSVIKERPPDDAQYLRRAPKNPKLTNFVYHDDTV